MSSPMEFWGVEVKVGESLKVDPNDDFEGYIHISQVALGEVKKGKPIEPVVLYVKVEDQKLVLGTLVKDEIPQISLDIVLDQVSELSHNSKNASVYFTGYKAFRSDDESDGSDFSDSDEELVPLKEDVKEAAKSGKPAADASTKQVKVADPQNGKTVDPEKNEDDSDESDSDYSEDESSDDEIDTDALAGSSDEETPAKKVDSDDSDESEQDATPKTIDSDSEIDSDEESEEETPAKVTQSKNNKRGNGAGSQTPVPAKKAKNGTPEKTDGKKGGHVATPHPTKQGGKFNQNAAKGQNSNSSKSGAFKSGQQNKKTKQGRR